MRARVAHAADVAKQPPELKQVALLALHMRHAGRYSSDKKRIQQLRKTILLLKKHQRRNYLRANHLVCAHFPWLSSPPRAKHGKADSAADIGLQAPERRLCATEQISDEKISPCEEALEAAGPRQCAELKGEATSRYAGSQARIA